VSPAGFEWDPAKAQRNLWIHGVSFEEAITVFDSGRSRLSFDAEHSSREDRFMIVGISAHGRLLAVWHTYRDPRIRIIGARLATLAERRTYEKKQPPG
jgi:uncharacterized DUF497 family protein